MADLAVIIRKVRRKVYDYSAPQFYDDGWYEDAIDDGLGRLNFDCGTTYSVATLPENTVWLVALLAAINMCYIRSRELHQDPNFDESIVGNVRRLEVDGLETEFFDKDTPAPIDWLKYAEELEDQYRKFKDQQPELDTETPVVSAVTVVREDLRNNRGLKNFNMDVGLSASVLNPSIAFTSNGAEIYWAPVYSTQFYSYRIERKLQSDSWDNEATTTRVATIHDNHIVKHFDTTALSLTPNTYTYRIVLVNRNMLKSYTSDLTVVIT